MSHLPLAPDEAPAAAESFDPRVARWVRHLVRGERPEADEAVIRQLASLPLDQVVELLVRHRVAPWVAAALAPHQDRLPTAAWTAVHGASEHYVTRTLAHYVELIRILRGCAEDGIDVVVLKGPAIANEWYPLPDLRPYGDLDLLVADEHLGPLGRRLQDAGYLRKPSDHDDPVHHEHAEFQHIYMHPRTRQIVEVHANHLQIGLRPVAMRDIWERARPVQFHTAPARVLEHHDLFVHLAVHLHRHGFERLMWFKDLDLMVRRGHLDWERVEILAAAEGCRESLAAALEYLVLVLETPLPPEAQRLLARRSRLSRWLFHRAWRPAEVAALVPRRRWRMRRAVQFAPETGVLRGGLAAFLFTGRRRDKVRVLLARALPSRRS